MGVGYLTDHCRGEKEPNVIVLLYMRFCFNVVFYHFKVIVMDTLAFHILDSLDTLHY